MLELAKDILQKVSFDPALFKKELLKAINWLENSEEVTILRDWCKLNFSKNHASIINEVFA